jgi:hypothetical protein
MQMNDLDLFESIDRARSPPINQSNQTARPIPLAPLTNDGAPPPAYTHPTQAAARWVKDHHKEDGTHSSALFRVSLCDMV